ncbi:MAG: excinuclease ABC subunit UvrA [Anaerolineales bacterium]|nr:excinuclease ABC subunit UvrA [Anaerolineales bacterium]
MNAQIIIRGARLHNLKNITVSIPKNQLVVLSGLSGSGKSTLGFDILVKESQRQYLESLGMVAFGMSKPPLDSITGLSPAISVGQRLSHHSPRSTVGTVSEVYTYLRVLYARLGHRPCPRCGQDIPPVSGAPEDWQDSPSEGDDMDAPEESFPCPHCGAPVPEIGMANFSFNKPAGACPTCTGLGSLQQANLARLVDEDKSLLNGAIIGWDMRFIRFYVSTIHAAARHYGFEFDPSLPVRALGPPQRDLLFFGASSPQFQRHFPGVQPPATVHQGRFEGIHAILLRRYAEHMHNPDYRQKMAQYLLEQTCPDCAGTRLRPESRAVTVAGMTIVDASRLPLSELSAWLEHLPSMLKAEEMTIAGPLLSDLSERAIRLVQVGLDYLTLARSSPSLSAGEAQRLRLASLLGCGLSGVLYVFEEPTIGLHQRDTHRLIESLRRLRDLGNTVLVMEHDLEMIRAADYVIDLGPGAGKHGGQIVATGAPAEVAAQAGSLTADYLAGRKSIPIPTHRRPPSGKFITIRGARQNNLQNITVRLPLGLLVAVTGVSGSGKSSLVFDILDRAARQRFYASAQAPGDHDAIEGLEHLQKGITIDQESFGRMPRSNAATYSDTYTPIRQAFAATDEARQRGLTARHFSFNLPGGRCERCQGAGTLAVKMHFLPDVEVRCPVCRGRRFTHQTLAVRYRGCDISQVLDLTVDEALQLFADVPAAASRLKVMSDVGLGYLQLGQPATTLSGGEAQRVKLAKELGRRGSGRTLYLLDEPTSGLHLEDVAHLLAVLQRLVEAGNTVVVVEHNLDLVKAADWVIDLGPEGGAAGGRIIAEGTPEQVAEAPGSYTGEYLRGLCW